MSITPTQKPFEPSEHFIAAFKLARPIHQDRVHALESISEAFWADGLRDWNANDRLPPLIEPDGFPVSGSPGSFIEQLSKPLSAAFHRVHSARAGAFSEAKHAERAARTIIERCHAGFHFDDHVRRPVYESPPRSLSNRFNV
jgi:hypothetical protein